MVTTILCPSVTVGTSPTCCSWLTPEIHCLQIGQSSLSILFPMAESGFEGGKERTGGGCGKGTQGQPQVPGKAKDTEVKSQFYCLLTKGLFL